MFNVLRALIGSSPVSYHFYYFQLLGEWTDWTKKADCSKTCGDGQQIWERKCVDATTKKYERWVTCEGPSTNVTMCNLRQCPGEQSSSDKGLLPNYVNGYEWKKMAMVLYDSSH